MTVLGQIDRRVLGAFRCVDACSRQQITDLGGVASATLSLRRNASGFFVVFSAPGMLDRTTQFDPVKPWPAPANFEVTLQPDSRRYLPRRATIAMPRSPEKMSDPASSMNAVDVLVYPTAAAPMGLNWAVLRCSVRKKDSPDSDPGLPWAVLRLTRQSDGKELATGLCDRRGEGVMAVPGLGQSTSNGGGGAVVTSTIDATVTAYFNPANLTRAADWIPNPDDVLKALNGPGLKKATQSAKVGRGTLSTVKLPIAL